MNDSGSAIKPRCFRAYMRVGQEGNETGEFKTCNQ
jgi:hypothetical protein